MLCELRVVIVIIDYTQLCLATELQRICFHESIDAKAAYVCYLWSPISYRQSNIPAIPTGATDTHS